MNILITTEKEKLDTNFIHQFLTQSYWAKGRTIAEVQSSIENSMCFGIYHNTKQIGFARVVTDYTIFGYIMDLFIAEEYRGKGYSKQLTQTILTHPKLQSITKWMLATKDAHGLYQQFGFKPLENPSKLMEK